MTDKTYEILSSQIVDIDLAQGVVKTEDGENIELNSISIVSDCIRVVEVPYSGDEAPTFLDRHVTSSFRANLPA